MEKVDWLTELQEWLKNQDIMVDPVAVALTESEIEWLQQQADKD